MHRNRPVALLTGFGPFPGAPRNASAELAEQLAAAAARRMPGWRVEAAVLPTEWEAGPRRLAHLLDELRPAVALHFGVSRRARGFVIETRARNAAGDVCDAATAKPAARCLDASGPDTLAAMLPTSLIAARLRRMGLPVQISRDAGTYLCNAVLYASLLSARDAPGRDLRRGFIHLPDRLLPTPGGRRAVPSLLDWPGALEGGLAILAACAGAQRPPIRG